MLSKIVDDEGASRTRVDAMNANNRTTTAFPRTWWPVVVLGTICVLLLYWSVRLMMPVINGNETGQSVIAALLSAAAFALLGPYLFWMVVRDAVTIFTEEGISRPTVRGRRAFLWKDLVRINSYGNYGVLVFRTGNVAINLLMFRDPRQVVAYVRSQVSPSTSVSHAGLRDDANAD